MMTQTSSLTPTNSYKRQETSAKSVSQIKEHACILSRKVCMQVILKSCMHAYPKTCGQS